MRVLPRRAGVVVVAALGLAGVGLAHVLEYLALVPDTHHRAEVLADTGHQYLPSALSAITFLSLLGLTAAFLSALRRGAGLGRGRRPFVSADWARLLPVAQVLAFVAIEIGERIASGASLSDLGPVLVLGLPLQVLVGVAGGRLLSAVTRAGEQLGRALAGPPPTASRNIGTCWRPVLTAVPVSVPSGGPLPARGPPPLLVVV